MKLTSHLLLGGLAACILALPLMASPVTYTYTGLYFQSGDSGPYTDGDYVSGYFTVPTALPDMALTPITPSTYSFTDQVQTFSSTSPPPEVTFEIGVSGGAIDAWDIVLQSGTYYVSTIDTSTVEEDGGEYDFIGSASNLEDPGSWLQSGGGLSPTPEPGNVGLIALGLVGIGLVRRKMQHRNQPVD